MMGNVARFPLWFPVLLGSGIAWYFSRQAPLLLWPYGLAFISAIALIFLFRRHLAAVYGLIAVVAITLGVLASGFRIEQVTAPVLSDPIYFKPVTGTVEDIQYREKKIRLVLSNPAIETLEAKNTPHRLSVTVRKLDKPLKIGDRVSFPAMLFPPPSPAMPGAYDFSRMFYFDQLGAVGFSPRQPEILPSLRGAEGDAAIQLREDGSPRFARDDIIQQLTALRIRIADHLQRQMGKDIGAIAAALMVGDQSRVSESIADSMRDSGIYHILSISGLHMTLATGLIFFTLRLILVLIPYTAIHWPNKKIAAVGGLLGGFAYLLLAGSPVPAVRAYIMVACVLAAVLVERRGISMVSLAWAATIILLVMPESLFSASFQLTFAATLAIVALYENYGDKLFHANTGPISRVGFYVLGLVLTSLAATLYTTPLAITHFNRMSLYGILTNTIMVPLSSFIIMPSAMVSLITMPFGWDAPFLYVLGIGLKWMMALSNAVTSIPFANVTLPSPSHVGFIAMIVGGLWLAVWTTRMRFLGLIPVIAGLATIALFKPYDMIISDDAKRVAYRHDNQWIMVRGDIDSYEAETWLRAQGAEVMLSRSDGKKIMPELLCDKSSCMFKHGEQVVLVMLKKEKDVHPCESGANIIITDRTLNCYDDTLVIDRDYTGEHGSVALRLENQPEIYTAEKDRGNWPWVKQTLVEEPDETMIQP